VRRLSLAIAIALMSTSARADDPGPDGPVNGDLIREIRELFEKGDYVHAREKVLLAYTLAPSPPLLFVLGQVEFNLRHWQAAIGAYEKFIASGPPEEQIALAQQGIGAARIEMQREAERPPPPAPPAPRHRAWLASDTIIVASGGGAVALGAALFFYGRHVGNDRSGSLADYADRTDRARLLQWTAGGLAVAGAIAAGVAVVRWRLRPDDGEVVVTPAGAAVSFTW
jgi:hypothetical protein